MAIGAAPAGGPFASSAPPDDLDWDMWVGPAPQAGYSEQRRNNIALMLGRELRWNPNKEQFVGDEQATALVSRKSRDRYLLASVS